MHHRCWVDTYADLLPPGWLEGYGPQDQVRLWRRVLAERPQQGVRRVAVIDDEGAPVAWSVAGRAGPTTA